MSPNVKGVTVMWIGLLVDALIVPMAKRFDQRPLGVLLIILVTLLGLAYCIHEYRIGRQLYRDGPYDDPIDPKALKAFRMQHRDLSFNQSVVAYRKDRAERRTPVTLAGPPAEAGDGHDTADEAQA
ncbi:hypothetical protein [Bifidobacterium xylocopae]|uniref:Uncharacterized protein n=1 Tax=Bifidobacterium xylocopae TaxID=2493119 RepID=A0A366KC30_9BIFI|nr:hypothetical protein [Bifidobacterium xylocopae]RBP99295.1 hypothetical protein CRD59_04535 [Bifidobacterium xylocopae]